jgi:hypothetical protein
MKFLISNYSTPWSTESHYFNAGLNLIEGTTSTLFDQSSSIYDNFDRVQPDVFITYLDQISIDVVAYLREKQNIKLIINVDAIPEERISKVCSSLISMDIKPHIFSKNDLKIDNVTHSRILAAADTFLHRGKKEYSIDKLIFVENKDQIQDLDCSCHYTTVSTSDNSELLNDVDFVLPITALNSIFPNYEEIVFKGGMFIGSQLAFNAIYSGTKVVFDTKESKELDKIDSIFKGQKLLSSVKNKHTCLHRLKSLLSQVSYSDLASKLESEINKL